MTQTRSAKNGKCANDTRLPVDEGISQSMPVAGVSYREDQPYRQDVGSIIIVNAMVGAETMTGVSGHKVYALPHDKLQEVLKKYNRLAK